MKNMHGHTLDLLGEAIVAGRYAAGDSMPSEPVLGDQLGVSRAVQREAVKSLAAKGLVVTGPRLGTRVPEREQCNWFDPAVVAWQGRVGLMRAFLRDLQELRRVVEPAAVRLAAIRATARDLAGLEAAYAGMIEAVVHDGDYAASDLRFHQGLLRASHNRMLSQMGKALAALLRASFEISGRPNARHQSLPLHRAVLDAVRERSLARAEQAILVLIDGAGEDIEQVLASRRRLPSIAPFDRRGSMR
jgi:DNA-binding FadR family transcriptional regulator